VLDEDVQQHALLQRRGGVQGHSYMKDVLQVSLLEAGEEDSIVQETRLFDEGKQITYSMRKKEGLADYRYFPEPDLPPLLVTDEYVSSVEVRVKLLSAAPGCMSHLLILVRGTAECCMSLTTEEAACSNRKGLTGAEMRCLLHACLPHNFLSWACK
jgi:hypothetical protein